MTEGTAEVDVTVGKASDGRWEVTAEIVGTGTRIRLALSLPEMLALRAGQKLRRPLTITEDG